MNVLTKGRYGTGKLAPARAAIFWRDSTESCPVTRSVVFTPNRHRFGLHGRARTRGCGPCSLYIDDFAEDDVEQREPGKALNSLDDQSEAFEQSNGKKVSNSGDAAPG